MSTKTTETVSSRIIEIISVQVDIPKEQISLNSHFMTDLGFDSLDLVEFGMSAEEEFDITLPDEVGDSINTVEEAVQLILKLSP